MEYLTALDRSLFRFLNTAFENRLFDFLAPLPETGLFYVLLFGALGMVFFSAARYRAAGVMLLAGDTLGGYAQGALKDFFHRARPGAALDGVRVLIEKTTFSFPSGHTCSAFMAAVYLYFVFGRKAGIVFLSLAVLVGLSRIYCGVHYPADVVAGAALGSVLGALLRVMEKRLQLPADCAAQNVKA